jgi:tRNA-dihydrouridine synthase
MVQLGAYVLDAPGGQSGHYYPDSERGALTAHLRADFDTFRRLDRSDETPLVCANVFLCEERSLEPSARAFMDADGDLYELNVHGGIGGDRERGTGRFMFLPEHAEKLHRWVRTLAGTGVPLIVKGRCGVIADFGPHLERFEEAGVFGFHINVRGAEEGVQNLAALQDIREKTRLLLLASGYVKDEDGARRLFDAGADAVGIAEAVRDDAAMFVGLGGKV